jgi:hypothetical protein
VGAWAIGELPGISLGFKKGNDQPMLFQFNPLLTCATSSQLGLQEDVWSGVRDRSATKGSQPGMLLGIGPAFRKEGNNQPTLFQSSILAYLHCIKRVCR